LVFPDVWTLHKILRAAQEKLAEYLDVSTHYIYEIEKCGKTPSFPMMIKIAELFHTSIDSLLSDNDTKKPNTDDNHLMSLINSLSADKQEKLYKFLQCTLPYLKL